MNPKSSKRVLGIATDPQTTVPFRPFDGLRGETFEIPMVVYDERGALARSGPRPTRFAAPYPRATPLPNDTPIEATPHADPITSPLLRTIKDHRVREVVVLISWHTDLSVEAILGPDRNVRKATMPRQVICYLLSDGREFRPAAIGRALGMSESEVIRGIEAIRNRMVREPKFGDATLHLAGVLAVNLRKMPLQSELPIVVVREYQPIPLPLPLPSPAPLPAIEAPPEVLEEVEENAGEASPAFSQLPAWAILPDASAYEMPLGFDPTEETREPEPIPQARKAPRPKRSPSPSRPAKLPGQSQPGNTVDSLLRELREQIANLAHFEPARVVEVLLKACGTVYAISPLEVMFPNRNDRQASEAQGLVCFACTRIWDMNLVQSAMVLGSGTATVSRVQRIFQDRLATWTRVQSRLRAVVEAAVRTLRSKD